MNVKLTALGATLVVTLLLQGCFVYRVATAPIRFAAHRVKSARDEKRGERKAEKRSESEAENRAPAPSHIERPDLPVPPVLPLPPVEPPAN